MFLSEINKSFDVEKFKEPIINSLQIIASELDKNIKTISHTSSVEIGDAPLDLKIKIGEMEYIICHLTKKYELYPRFSNVPVGVFTDDHSNNIDVFKKIFDNNSVKRILRKLK